MQASDLANEWSLLQNQFDSYEKYSLLIKLSSIALVCATYFSDSLSTVAPFLLLILWLQDSIWKTFQSRIDTRLLQLESYLSSGHQLENVNGKAYQFNSLYLQSRPSSAGLINEYFRQAIRPTIALPYVLLLLILAYELIFKG